MTDRKTFFSKVRETVFSGKMQDSQVLTLEAMLTQYEVMKWADVRWLAAVMGTAMTEVGENLIPIQENLNYGAQGLADTFPSRCAVNPKARVKVPNERAKSIARKPEQIANYVYSNKNGNGDPQSGEGWKYRGRGYAQVTGRANYEKLTKANTRGWDFVNDPDLLLQVEPSVWALMYGMEVGLFTGLKLSTYFNKKRPVDWAGSRAIINGTFHAEKYKGYCLKFLPALS